MAAYRTAATLWAIATLLVSAVARAAPSYVVTVQAQVGTTQHVATGVIVACDGSVDQILTAYHVVSSRGVVASRIVVCTDTACARARIRRSDPVGDLALLSTLCLRARPAKIAAEPPSSPVRMAVFHGSRNRRIYVATYNPATRVAYAASGRRVPLLELALQTGQDTHGVSGSPVISYADGLCYGIVSSGANRRLYAVSCEYILRFLAPPPVQPPAIWRPTRPPDPTPPVPTPQPTTPPKQQEPPPQDQKPSQDGTQEGRDKEVLEAIKRLEGVIKSIGSGAAEAAVKTAPEWLPLLISALGGAGGVAGIWGLLRLVRLLLAARRIVKSTTAVVKKEQPAPEPMTDTQPTQQTTQQQAEKVKVVGPRDVEYIPYPEICKSCKAWEMALREFVRVEPGMADAAERIRAYYRQFLSGMR